MTKTAEIRALVFKYLTGVEQVFSELKVIVDQPEVFEVIDCAKRYLSDAKFFADQGKFKTALVSVVYCEGLLDALKMLKVVEFSWSFAKNHEQS
jgi:FAD synthetase